MIAKFVYISDVKGAQLSKKQGIQAYHRDWADLYNDATVGDSLANMARHWDKECAVNPGFLFIGGRESIQAVLDHEASIRLINPFDSTGVAAMFCRSKGSLTKTYTIVPLLPLSFAHHDNTPVNTLGDISAQITNMGKKDFPDETLDDFRKRFSRVAELHGRYGNI